MNKNAFCTTLGVILLASCSIIIAQTITRYDAIHLNPNNMRAVWDAGIREMLVKDPQVTAPNNPGSMTIYRTVNSKGEVNWAESHVLVKWGENRRLVYLGAADNELKKSILRAIRSVFSISGIREGSVEVKQIEGEPCATLLRAANEPRYLDIHEFISLFDTMLTIEVLPGKLFFSRADISLKHVKGENEQLKITNLNYLASTSLDEDIPLLRIRMSDWVVPCLVPDTMIFNPRLSIYHSQTAPDKYFIDPSDLQDLISDFTFQDVDFTKGIQVDLMPFTKQNWDFGSTFLPSHAVHRRNTALIGPSSYDPEKPLDLFYNTSLKPLSISPGYWKTTQSDQDKTNLLDYNTFSGEASTEYYGDFDYLKNPGLYLFNAQDTAYSINEDGGIHKGAVVILPELRTTNYLTSLDRAVSDINYEHYITLDTTFTRRYDSTRFVMSDRVFIEVEYQSRKLIKTKIIPEKPDPDNNERVEKQHVIIQTPVVEYENPLEIAREIDKEEETDYYYDAVNDRAMAYFRYVTIDGQPLQADLGREIDDEFWHVVYIDVKVDSTIEPHEPKKDIPWWVATMLSVSGTILLFAAI